DRARAPRRGVVRARHRSAGRAMDRPRAWRRAIRRRSSVRARPGSLWRQVASIAEVRGRHNAVAELRSKAIFREDLAVLAAESEVSRTGALAAWGQAAPAGLAPAAPLAPRACGVV